MRFTCEKSMLVQGLNIAGRTVAQKSSLSVIEGVLCKAGMGISLTGYNMETAITYDIPAEVADPGECILPAKLFGDIIRRLPEGPVTVVVSDDYKVSIRAGYASFTISAESAEDYPELPDVNSGRPVKIPQNRLKELISGTLFAVSENQGRPIHTGVKFEVTDTSITAIAVDGFRLARRTYHPEEGTAREMNFVVPAPGLKEVEKIVSDVEDNASFTLGTKHILFQIGNATLVCRLLEGDFLDWRKVVPTNCPIKLVADVVMAPDKEAAAIFAVLGYYPIIKPAFERTKMPNTCKYLYFNVVILAVYWLLINLMGLTEIAKEFAEMGILFTVVMLLMGNMIFCMLDRILSRIAIMDKWGRK